MQGELFVDLNYPSACDQPLEKNTDTSFKGLDGLTLTVVEPLKVWRIRFNGMLR